MKRIMALILVAVLCVSPLGMVVHANAAAVETMPLSITASAGEGNTVVVEVKTNQTFEFGTIVANVEYDNTVFTRSGQGTFNSNLDMGYDVASDGFLVSAKNVQDEPYMDQIDAGTTLTTYEFTYTSEANAGDYEFTLSLTTLADGDGVSIKPTDTTATATYNIGAATPTDKDYTADLGLPTGASTAVKVGDEVTVNILVGGTTNEFASSELNLNYTGLTYVPGKSTVNGADVTPTTGTPNSIKIIDHGDTTTWNEGNTVTAYALVFTVDAITGDSGTASVTLSDAALSTDEQAVGNNLTAATITTGTKTFTVTPADLKVVVPGELTASGSAEEKTVVYGESFVIEAADKNYDYELSAKVTGTESSVIITPDSTVDGKWTIASVTDNVTITVEKKNAKQFSVTINTMDHIEGTPATGANAATYETDYTFTLKANVDKQTGVSGWSYTVESITIGGTSYTDYQTSGQTITIPGSAITGDIEITTKKTEVLPGEYTITVNKDEGVNLTANPSEKVESGKDIALTLTPVAGYKYTVKYTIGGGAEIEITSWIESNGVKTATISNVTGNVVITATKEVNAGDIAVTVSEKEYLALNGKTMYLVQVTSKLDSGYVYTYGGSEMYYSNEYNKDNGGAYVYLVITDANTPLTADVAKTQISIAQGSVAATVDYSGDVNMTNRIDANDAQLVWNMYSAKTYSDFTTVNMEKFLRADVDKDGDVDVDDASAVVTAVKNRTN